MSNIHKNFNSRTREGATKKQLGGRIGLLVSIHAPVWVRLSFCAPLWCGLMFQFTHPCGCDCKQPDGPPHSASFNSRTRVGATLLCGEDESLAPVSIHAPVWVRLKQDLKALTGVQFQFTHPCGCDPTGDQNQGA